jgi:2-polyprenyl-3-methyl-5-hydroxy-6-metoxy-1,4-benzoquinol methylase
MSINRVASKSPLASWERDELEWLKACPVCQSQNSQILHDALVDYIFAAAHGHWKLLSCTDCKCSYLNPRPNRKTIGRAYSTYYTHGGAEKQNESLNGVRWIRRALANGYRNHLYGTNLSPSLGQLGNGVALLSRRFRNAIETEAAGISGVRPKIPGVSTILDIGCGSGLALSRARDAGWLVMGIEPDPSAAKSAAAACIEIIASDLSELPARFNGTFERILLNHVIEHVHDPLSMLIRCKELLTPKGELWLETPNLTSLGHEEFGIDWRGLEPPRHLVIFESSSLQSLLTEAGFKNVNLLKPRDVLNYMYERSNFIKKQRTAQSKSSFSNQGDKVSKELDQLIRRARSKIAKQPSRSEFLTLTAST